MQEPTRGALIISNLIRILILIRNGAGKLPCLDWGSLLLVLSFLPCASHGQPQTLFAGSPPLLHYSPTNYVGAETNGPATFDTFVYWRTNITKRYNEGIMHNLPTNLPPEVLHRIASLSTQTVSQIYGFTNRVFTGYAPNSLNYLVWTNFIAHTNGRTTRIWSERIRPPGWPEAPPRVKWDTNCLMWSMKGETALSPSWEQEGSPGQVPITALTRRHGYTRGHGMGPDGFRTLFAGKKVWFLTKKNTLIQATVAREVVRITNNRDYTIVLFKQDLPADIETMSVLDPKEFFRRCPLEPDAPWVFFKTEQSGNVSAEIPGFTVPTWKGGDSGSPNMLPLPGQLVFCGGRSTSGASPEMQADMDELCRLEHLDPRKYQLNWVSLGSFPKYSF